MTRSTRTLERELKERLTEGPYALSTEAAFLDLAWDGDATVEEVTGRDLAVIVDAVDGPRRIVIQRIRGELRYWLTTNRDPDIASRSPSVENQLGTVHRSMMPVALAKSS